ncbi:MAG: hypothetical protein U1E33_02500 [Rhodospirillales bacterium]
MRSSERPVIAAISIIEAQLRASSSPPSIRRSLPQETQPQDQPHLRHGKRWLPSGETGERVLKEFSFEVPPAGLRRV